MPRTDRKMVLATVKLTKEMIEGLDELVRRGIYPNKSEAIRAAITMFLADMRCPRDEKEEEDDFPVLRGRW